MRMRRTAACAGVGLLLALPATAQQMQRQEPPQAAAGTMPDSYREVQVRALELQRRMLLVMADSMPEQLYRDKVTPPQRDFAQQIQHAAGALPFILNRVANAPRASLPDTSTIGTRQGLRAYVNACYDYAAGFLRSQTAADRAATVNLFGNQIPGWQLWDELHQHTIWTAGQVVANFRKHGMAPPGFGFF